MMLLAGGRGNGLYRSKGMGKLDSLLIISPARHPTCVI